MTSRQCLAWLGGAVGRPRARLAAAPRLPLQGLARTPLRVTLRLRTLLPRASDAEGTATGTPAAVATLIAPAAQQTAKASATPPAVTIATTARTAEDLTGDPTRSGIGRTAAKTAAAATGRTAAVRETKTEPPQPPRTCQADVPPDPLQRQFCV